MRKIKGDQLTCSKNQITCSKNIHKNIHKTQISKNIQISKTQIKLK